MKPKDSAEKIVRDLAAVEQNVYEIYGLPFPMPHPLTWFKLQQRAIALRRASAKKGARG